MPCLKHRWKRANLRENKRSKAHVKLLDGLSWPVVIALAFLLGLAPFTPEPHLWEKLKLLTSGDLVRSIDWFDLIQHGAPWGLLLLKILRHFRAT